MTITGMRVYYRITRKEVKNMAKTSVTYTCPNADKCPRHKHCHVLTTATELKQEIAVWQQCVAAGKNADGTTKEILIHIGKVA